MAGLLTSIRMWESTLSLGVDDFGLDPEIEWIAFIKYNLLISQEAESGNISQKSDEEDFVKVEDLPLKLTIYSEVFHSL